MGARTVNRWVVLGAAGVINALVGAVYIWSIFNIPLMESRGWIPQEISFAYSLFILTEGATGFFVGWLQRRISPRVLVLCGGVLFSTGWFMAGIVQSPQLFCLLYSVVGGLGSGTLYNTAVSTATRWFSDKRGLANGICIGCTGLSPLLFAPLGNFLIEHVGVSLSFSTCGAIYLACILAVFTFMQAPPEGWNYGEADAIAPEIGLTPTQMVRTPVFWTLWLMFMTSAAAGMMVIGHASSIGQDMAGLTSSQAALQVGILAIGNFSGRILFATLSDRWGRFSMLLVALTVTAVVMVFFFGGVHDFATLTVALCVVGACFGGVMSIMPALAADLFGSKHFGQNYAALFFGYSVASVIGPLLGAAMLQQTGSYSAAFPAAGALTCVGIALCVTSALIVKRARSRSEA